jgi:murein peptide amidase A
VPFFQRAANVAALSFGLAACLTVPAFGKAVNTSAQSDWCKRLAGRLPSISVETCQSSALKPTGAVSRQGFPILMRQVPAAKGETPVRILLIGGIHGDELTASAIVFQWMQWMHGPLAQGFQWEIVPVLNPDGLLAPKPRRMNANGVDLNRNFPTPGWQKEAPSYWARVTKSDPRRFPGSAPLSEPESRWVHEEMERFHPNVIISVHAPFGVLDFDGPVKPPYRFGRLIFNRVGVYPGSLGNYSGLHKNVPVITIELPNARAMPPDAEVRRIWQDMLTWIQRNVPHEMDAGKATVRRTAEKAAIQPH